MRLAWAELLGMRKRMASYIVLIVLLALMALIYVVIGLTGATAQEGVAQLLAFPQAYTMIGQLVFGVGSLVAVAYAAAVAGGDWTWGVPRVLISRGESRGRYVLAKALALAVVLAVGVLIAFAAGLVLNLAAAAMAGVDTGNPLEGDGPLQLLRAVGLGYPVLIERALIGFAVAIVLRSQLAGVVVGILLYLGESILATIMLAVTLAGRGVSGLLDPIGPEWFQFLPFSIGDSVIASEADPATGGLEGLLFRPVPLEIALLGVVLYGVVALAVAVVVVERAEITA